jgi:hypothetical protein
MKGLGTMYVPTIKASLSVTPDTRVEAIDREAPGHDYRIVILAIGDLSLHIGSADDAAAVAVLDRLAEALLTLRSAALRRMAETEAVPV